MRPHSCLLLLALLACAGCGTASAWVRGVAPLNRNEANESTPVDVRFYQLAGQDAFQRATFEALWVDAAKVLGDSMLGTPVVVTVVPGSRSDAPTEVALGALDGKATHIGVMALFRRTDGADRRLLVVPVDRIGKEVVELNGYSVALAVDPAASPSGKAADTTPTPAAQGADGDERTHAKGGRTGG